MASSGMRTGPVSLTQVRHEQRRVAALLRASGQVDVSFPPYEGIPSRDLYKSKFYRQLQAGNSIHATKVPPLSLAQLPVKPVDVQHAHNPLVSSYGSAVLGNGDGKKSVTVLGKSFQSDHALIASTRRQTIGLRKTLSKSLLATTGVLDDSNHRLLYRGDKFSSFNLSKRLLAHAPCRKSPISESKSPFNVSKRSTNLDLANLESPGLDSRSCLQTSVSKYEALPSIDQSPLKTDFGKESVVQYRLPKSRQDGNSSVTDEQTTIPLLHYKHGVAQPIGKPVPTDTFSPTGRSSENTVSDLELVREVRPRHRKRRHPVHSGLTYDHDHVPFNSPVLSSSSSSSPSVLSTTSHSDAGNIPENLQTKQVRVDNRLDDNDESETDVAGVTAPDAESLYTEKNPDLEPRKHPSKNDRALMEADPDDDPYGRAYVQALSLARTREMQKYPFYLEQRLTRPFTFSYFCQKEVCTCGHCHKNKRGKAKGKTGFKAIFGDVDMYDYFKWSK